MGKKVLLIDDDPTIIMLLRIDFIAHHYEVVIAKDGEEGFLKAQEECPDVIVLDALMPGLSGLEVVEKIRELKNPLRDVPIIVISAKASMRNALEDADIQGFVKKPFAPRDLIKLAEEALAKRVQEVKQETPPVAADEAMKDLANSGRSIVLAGVEAFILSKVKQHLESLRYQVALAADEIAAIDLAFQVVPRFIFCQFWKDAEQFDAAKIYTLLKQDPATQAIPVVAFCNPDVKYAVNKVFPPEQVIRYQESKDLLASISDLINRCA